MAETCRCSYTANCYRVSTDPWVLNKTLKRKPILHCATYIYIESKLLAWVPVKPFIWLRYIDDIFMVWTEGEDKLLEFLHIINNFHDTIKFTFDWSRDCINYLDVQVINKGGVIETDLYTKPTDKHQYLYHTSCHPKGCKANLFYACFVREQS